MRDGAGGHEWAVPVERVARAQGVRQVATAAPAPEAAAAADSGDAFGPELREREVLSRAPPERLRAVRRRTSVLSGAPGASCLGVLLVASLAGWRRRVAVGPALLCGDAAARGGAEAWCARAAAGEQQARVLGDVEAQFLAGIRRKDGRTVGLGL
jgi:hypothetical protein